MEDMARMETTAAATVVKALKIMTMNLAEELMAAEKESADMMATMVTVTETSVTESTTEFIAAEMEAVMFMATEMEAAFTATEMEGAKLMSVKTKIRTGKAMEMLAMKFMTTARTGTEEMTAQIAKQTNSTGMTGG